MQVQVQARERPRLFSGTAGQDIAAARVVGFACVGALLHQLRTPRNTWGGAAAAQAAADVLLEEEERERARARAPAAPAIAAPAPAPPADEDRAISSAEASTAPEAPREAEGESGALVALPAEDEQLCRFCFGGADEMPGGLISPCQCKGTQVSHPAVAKPLFLRELGPLASTPSAWGLGPRIGKQRASEAACSVQTRPLRCSRRAWCARACSVAKGQTVCWCLRWAGGKPLKQGPAAGASRPAAQRCGLTYQ